MFVIVLMNKFLLFKSRCKIVPAVSCSYGLVIQAGLMSVLYVFIHVHLSMHLIVCERAEHTLYSMC